MVAAALPAIPWLRDLRAFGALQYNDYYGILAQVIDGDRFTASPLRWLLIKSNEHTVPLPALLYALNYHVSAGDNRVLSFLSILLGWVTAAIVAAMILPALPGGHGTRIGASIGVAFAVSALLFTPAGVHNYVMGFSGTMWLLSNVFAVAAMASLTRVEGGEARIGCAQALRPVAFGVLGALSYSTNFALWPALLIGGFVTGCRARKLAVIGITSALVFGAQGLVRMHPAHHPALSRDVWGIARFVGTYLGAPFAEDLRVALLIGWGGSAVFLAGVFQAVRLREWRLAPFVMLSVYGLGTSLGTAVARSGFGLEQALSSRYTSLAILFWIGVLGTVAWFAGRSTAHLMPLRPRARGWLVAGVVAALFTMFLVTTSLRGMAVRREYLDLAAWHPVAALALRHGVRDELVLTQVSSALSHFDDRHWLKRMGHVPFTIPSRTPFKITVDSALLEEKPDPRVVGYFDGLLPVRNGAARAQGWAFARSGSLAEVLLLDGAGVVQGELVVGTPRPDVVMSPSFTDAPRDCGVAGYVLASEGSGPLRMYARLKGDRRYAPLVGEHKVPERKGG